jgi:hypothetical protein
MSVTLYREIDALGGAAMSGSVYDQAYHDGYSKALDLVFEILERRGFSEHGDPIAAVIDAIKPILDDLGVPGSDGWTEGYAHVTDLDRLQAAIAEVAA